MDLIGHIALGAAVTGQFTPYTVALSVLPDAAALPLQSARVRRHIQRYPLRLAFYRLVHSPLTLLLAYWLPEPGFLLVATHIVADMFTHKQPYSEFGIGQWDFNKPWYWALVTVVAALAIVRYFYFPGA